MSETSHEIKRQTTACMRQLLDAAGLEAGDILVVGCSTSEIMGKRIGSAPADEAAEEVFAAIHPLLRERGVRLAAQCCEHLNRALVIEKEAALRYGLPPVSVVPVTDAGGSWAAKAYRSLDKPVVVEDLGCHKAAAGLDIGETNVGMHLRPVAVMVRPTEPWIGQARVTMARTRPKLIGGERAQYL
ncbi:MAG: TIGR01440 family protein [Clostridiales bacterium]|nr:TIGR01440 family protein [Clostridiales bacterium]